MLLYLNGLRRGHVPLLAALIVSAAACSPPPADHAGAFREAISRLESSPVPADPSSPATGDMASDTPTLASVEDARLARLKALTDLNAIDPEGLSDEDRQLFYQYYDGLAVLVELDRFGMAELDGPRPYLMTDVDGAHVRLANDLARQPITSRPEAEAWLVQLAAAAPALQHETQRFLVQTRTGIAPPQELIDRTIADLDRQLDASREPAPLAHFRTSLAAQTDIPAFEATRLLDEARAIYATDLVPELEELRDVFTLSASQTSPEPGLHARKDGDQRFRALFAYYASPNVAPDALLDFARQEVDANQSEIGERLASLATEEGIPPPTLAELAIGPPPEDAEMPEAPTDAAVLGRLTQRFDWARNNLAQLISEGGVRPLTMQSRAVAPHGPLLPVRHEATTTTTGADRLLADAATFQLWPDWSLPAHAFSSGLPGRHLIESRRVEHPLNAAGLGAALAEGWSLYATDLASDLGGFDDRIEDRIGYLQHHSLYAALAVIDIGIHLENWNRQEALDYLKAATSLPDPVLNSFIDESIRRPARLSAAFAGSVAIGNLRDRADTRLGPDFNLRQFHDAILAGGPRPLTTVDREIGAWIAAREPQAPAE